MESNKEEKIKTVSEENIYKLNGRVPLKKAIPFGLQHVLCLLYTSPSPRDGLLSRMPSSA